VGGYQLNDRVPPALTLLFKICPPASSIKQMEDDCAEEIETTLCLECEENPCLCEDLAQSTTSEEETDESDEESNDEISEEKTDNEEEDKEYSGSLPSPTPMQRLPRLKPGHYHTMSSGLRAKEKRERTQATSITNLCWRLTRKPPTEPLPKCSERASMQNCHEASPLRPIAPKNRRGLELLGSGELNQFEETQVVYELIYSC